MILDFTLTSEEAVSRGVAWLDNEGPAEWWDRVDLEILDVSDGNVCVAAQVFQAEADETCAPNGYYLLFQKLPDSEMIVELGFAGDDYDELTREWTAAIQNRRDEVSA